MRLASIIEKLKTDILGKEYSLSVGFADEARSQEINKQYRQKDKPTNVLSFAFSDQAGELVLCKPIIKKEAELLDKTFDEWLVFLIIHGLLHLKGLDHGKKMEQLEKKYLSSTKF